MRILLATPFLSQHFDSGIFWARALSRLGESLTLWDFRQDAEPPEGDYDLALVLKGAPDTPTKLRGPSSAQPLCRTYCEKLVCYWPDRWGRDVEAETSLAAYDTVYTMVRPNPGNTVWLPGAYDERVHSGRGLHSNGAILVGTNTPRKEEYMRGLLRRAPGLVGPKLRVFGNGWKGSIRPVYLHEYAEELSDSAVAINVHRDPGIGLNRRFFEMMACTFTITDRVPGVVEILGEDLAEKVAFDTPSLAWEMLDQYLRDPDQAAILWALERHAIRDYTYTKLCRRILGAL